MIAKASSIYSYRRAFTYARSLVTSGYQFQQHATDASQGLPEEQMQKTSLSELKQKLQIQYSRANMGAFTQTPPHQENFFTNNAFLTSYLRRVFPADVRDSVWNDLTRFGERLVTEIYPLARDCELNLPYVRTFDAWGNRTDELVTCESWKKLKAISAEEGIVSTAYEGKYGEYDRLYQMIKVYLFASHSGLYSCPLAMTDGAAKTASVSEDTNLKRAMMHLTSRNPKQFWTSGQWMTEKKGGSDVSGATDTVAVAQPDGSYLLFGYKWFSSATDSDMALTLASIVSEAEPNLKARNLTMFFLETRKADGKLNGIEIARLKNKLGTRQVPTAELLLEGTVAHRVSPEGRGIPSISNMLTITRLHNAMASASGMRRILQLSRDYSLRRSAFGQPVDTHVLHQLTMARMEVATRGCEIFSFHVARLLGREEVGVATETEKQVLRVLTPILKLFTAKYAMSVISEGLECFGGQGYMEDTGLPVMLRDAQVLPIWEGTTNILSLDLLRAVMKSKGQALTALKEDIKSRISFSRSSAPELAESCDRIIIGLEQLLKFTQDHPELIHVAARDVAFSLANIYIGGLLLEQAASDKLHTSCEVAHRWSLHPQLVSLTPNQYTDGNHSMVMDGYDLTQVYGPMF